MYCNPFVTSVVLYTNFTKQPGTEKNPSRKRQNICFFSNLSIDISFENFAATNFIIIDLLLRVFRLKI